MEETGGGDRRDRGGDSSEAQIVQGTTPPSDPVPEPVAGCFNNSANNAEDGRITKHKMTDDEEGEAGLGGCHLAAAIPLNNGIDPSELLLPEIWELVFDKLEDPQDWLNLYRASSYFQKLVGGKRTTALLTQVLPHVFKYLTESEILNVRQVPSRPWKRAVDKVLAKSNSESVTQVLSSSYDFRSSARISSFLERFEAHAGNPFVGRFASFRIRYTWTSEAIEEFSRLVSRLLAKFGDQLETARFGSSFNTHSANCGRWLARWLMSMPNLNSLQVEYHNSVPRVGLKFYVLAEALQSLPVIHNLKSITFRVSTMVRRRDLMDLQNAVVRLSCSPNSLKSVTTVGVPRALLTYPNVESAVVSFEAKRDYSNLARASWPLSKLTVSCHASVSDPYPPSNRPLCELFECVEHFKTTLTCLRVANPIFHDPSDSDCKLDLPHLKQLTIDRYDLMPLDCLTKLTNLEVLIIRHGNDSYPVPELPQGKSIIEVVQSDMARLRVGEGLPKLTKIWVDSTNVSTRSRPEFQRT